LLRKTNPPVGRGLAFGSVAARKVCHYGEAAQAPRCNLGACGDAVKQPRTPFWRSPKPLRFQRGAGTALPQVKRLTRRYRAQRG